MAEAGTEVGPAQSNKLPDVSARLQQVLALLFPSTLAAKAALFAVVVALLPLLPSSQAPRLWELPHLLLLGIIISYGVFGQKNADAAAAAAAKPVDDDGEPSVEAFVSEMMQGSFAFAAQEDDGDGGVQAWSSQYRPPEDPLVVVASSDDGKGGAGEKPLHLPVRKLTEKPATLMKEGGIGDGIVEEDEEERGEFLAPKAGYDDVVVRERAVPSPSSVLDADLTLSPSSSPPPPPPPPPPFLVGRRGLQKPKARSFNEFSTSGRRLGLLQSAGSKLQFRSRSARNAAFSGYGDPAAPLGYEAAGEDTELDLDDEVVAGAASDSSFSSGDMLSDNDDSYGKEEEEEEDSCDEELFELATRPGPVADEVEDEVDRKAEEFIAKFRDQIRMQRIEPPRR